MACDPPPSDPVWFCVRRNGAAQHDGWIADVPLNALPERVGAIRRNPDTAFADRVDFPVPSEHSRQQCDGLAVLCAEGQQCIAVAAPPSALGLESHAPRADA